MDFVILFGTLFGLLILGVPIGVSLGCGTLALMLLTTNMSPMLLAQSCFTGLDSFTLLAIPFFVIAGDFMMYGGISRRLLNLFNALVGHVTGGTASVTTIACMFFAAISGSGPATVSAIGSFMIPEMKEKNYDDAYAAALTACAGAIGVVIPPSIPFILYAVAVGCSVSDLFLAGVMPGILIGVFLIIVSYVLAKRNGWHGNDRKATSREVWKALKESILAILSPVIILGSIYAGVCSPTEAAVAGVVYSFVIGVFVYRELKWKEIVKSLIDSVLISGSTLFMVGITTMLGRVLTMKGIPTMLSETLSNMAGGPIAIMAVITVTLLIVGCFMDNISATIILAPLLLPTVMECGMTPVQFGVIMTMLLAIGFITPPYGINLFVASQLSKVPLMRIAKRAIPLMLVMLLAAVLTMVFPQLTMGLVNLLA